MTRRKLIPAMIMAGGRGSRLIPLTCHRSKPAVPFGGRYRIIDFVLSNFINSGYRQIYVLTQYMASSLIKHLSHNWHISAPGEFIEVVPAQMRMGEFWYRGTADAVYQNINLVRDSRAEHIAVFGGDHIYMFDVSQMEDAHLRRDADLTVAAIPVPQSEASAFGIIDVDDKGRIIGFVEKPKNPPTIPGRPGWSLVSMGNYIFRCGVLEEALIEDAGDESSKHDFGRNIIPRLVDQGASVYAYDFATNRIPGGSEDAQPYWRDVGSVENFFDANMDLRARLPSLDIYNRSWPIRTASRAYPPARFVKASADSDPVLLDDSLVCEGSIITGATLHESMLGYDCFVHAGSEVSNAVALSGCDIGAGAKLNRVLLDKNCRVDPGAEIGLDEEADMERFPFISDTGIVVLPKGTHVPATGPVQFAHDVEFLLRKDPDAQCIMEEFSGKYSVSEADRHSHQSAGPRYFEYAKRNPGDGAA